MQRELGPYWRGLAGMSLRRLGHLPVTQVTALAAFGLLSGTRSREGFMSCTHKGSIGSTMIP